MNSQPSLTVNEVNLQRFFRTLFLAVFAVSFTPLWPLLTSGSSLPSLIQHLVPWWIFPQSWQYLIFVTSLFFYRCSEFWWLHQEQSKAETGSSTHTLQNRWPIVFILVIVYIFLCWYLVELVRYPVYLNERKSSKMQEFFSPSNL